jgi:hypothetical protein
MTDDILKRVVDLRPGDYVDLEGDRFADPLRNKPTLQFIYQMVDAVERETADCVAVWFDGFDCVGFPPDHLVAVQR